MNAGLFPLLRLLALASVPPIAVFLFSRRFVRRESTRRALVFVELAALAPAFVIALAILGSLGGKLLIAVPFFLIAFLPFYIGLFRRGLAIRAASPAEAPALAELVNSAYRGETSKQGWTTEADLLGGQRTDAASLAALISRPGGVFLVVPRDGAFVACVHLKQEGDHAYLGMLTVRPDLQAAGLGRKLLEAAEDWARREWGVSRIEMTVIDKRPELIAWYERRGYRDTGRREPFPHDEKFGVSKVGDLTFVVLEKRLES